MLTNSTALDAVYYADPLAMPLPTTDSNLAMGIAATCHLRRTWTTEPNGSTIRQDAVVWPTRAATACKAVENCFSLQRWTPSFPAFRPSQGSNTTHPREENSELFKDSELDITGLASKERV